MQLLISSNHLGGTTGREVRIVRCCLGNLETGFIGHIILENIQNEILLNGLPHTVDVERMETAILIFCAEQLQRFILWRSGEGKEGQVLVLPLNDDLLHQLVVWIKFFLSLALQLGILSQSLLGVRQRRFQLEGGAARLGGVGLIHDDGKATSCGLVHLPEDHWELLQGSNNDPHPGVQSVPQILGGFIFPNRLHRAQRVVKAGDSFLELGIQHCAVGDDYHTAEYGLVLPVVQRCQTVGRPSDRVGFSGACTVLDKIVSSRSVGRHIFQQLPHHVQLVIAGKNQRFLFDQFLSAVRHPFLFFLDLQMDKLLQNIHHAVLLKDLLPEVGRGVAVRVWRIALAAVLPSPVGTLVEGQEVCILPGQLSGHPDLQMIHAEIA